MEKRWLTLKEPTKVFVWLWRVGIEIEKYIYNFLGFFLPSATVDFETIHNSTKREKAEENSNNTKTTKYTFVGEVACNEDNTKWIKSVSGGEISMKWGQLKNNNKSFWGQRYEQNEDVDTPWKSLFSLCFSLKSEGFEGGGKKLIGLFFSCPALWQTFVTSQEHQQQQHKSNSNNSFGGREMDEMMATQKQPSSFLGEPDRWNEDEEKHPRNPLPLFFDFELLVLEIRK